MAYRALYNGKPVRPFDLDIEERPFDLACVECSGDMHIVKEHPREGSKDVSRHFRHNSDGCGRGGGGGGEADIHKRRKEDALSKALTKMEELGYGVEKYGVEGSDAYPVEYIGEHRPDSFLEFEETHWRYGDGLAIEYQHKNEDKDREAVSEAYADELYTTVWLWGDQFDNGEINLFGGEVVIAWPKHVPGRRDWPTSKFREEERKWEKAKMRGLTGSHVPARMPKEWHDEQAQSIWGETSWDEIFTPPESDKYLSQSAIPRSPPTRNTTVTLPPEAIETIIYEYSPWEWIFDDSNVPHYIAGAMANEPTNAKEVPAAFTESMFDTRIYRESRWGELFPSPTPDLVENGDWSKTVNMPFFDWFPTEATEGWLESLKRGVGVWEYRERIDKPPTAFDDVQCHSCGHYQHSPNAGNKCNNCGEAYDWEWNVATGRISEDSIP